MKLMYIQYITYSFSMAIGPHVCGSWNITKQKKNERIMQCPFIKSLFLWYGSGFFLKIYIYALLFKNAKNTFFWMKFHRKFVNFYMVLDLIHVYQYYTP